MSSNTNGREKHHFFLSLSELDQDEEIEPIDHGHLSSQQFLKLARSSRPRSSPTPLASQPAQDSNSKEMQKQGGKPDFKRSLSAPNPIFSASESYDTPSTFSSVFASTLHASATCMAPKQQEKSTKRKRGNAIQLVPEHQRIFDGLNFCSSQTCAPMVLSLLTLASLLSKQRHKHCSTDENPKGSRVWSQMVPGMEHWRYAFGRRQVCHLPSSSEISQARLAPCMYACAGLWVCTDCDRLP